MKARLLKDREGQVKLLCGNGSISDTTTTVLANLLLHFKNAAHFSGSEGEWSTTYGDMAVYPGETLAYVTDDLSLVVLNPSVFDQLVAEQYKTNSYITLGEYAEKWNKSREIIKILCRSGRLVGAQKMAGRWMIPKDAPYPIPPERQRPNSGRTKA